MTTETIKNLVRELLELLPNKEKEEIISGIVPITDMPSNEKIQPSFSTYLVEGNKPLEPGYYAVIRQSFDNTLSETVVNIATLYYDGDYWGTEYEEPKRGIKRACHVVERDSIKYWFSPNNSGKVIHTDMLPSQKIKPFLPVNWVKGSKPPEPGYYSVIVRYSYLEDLCITAGYFDTDTGWGHIDDDFGEVLFYLPGQKIDDVYFNQLIEKVERKENTMPVWLTGRPDKSGYYYVAYKRTNVKYPETILYGEMEYINDFDRPIWYLGGKEIDNSITPLKYLNPEISLDAKLNKPVEQGINQPCVEAWLSGVPSQEGYYFTILQGYLPGVSYYSEDKRIWLDKYPIMNNLKSCVEVNVLYYLNRELDLGVMATLPQQDSNTVDNYQVTGSKLVQQNVDVWLEDKPQESGYHYALLRGNKKEVCYYSSSLGEWFTKDPDTIGNYIQITKAVLYYLNPNLAAGDTNNNTKIHAEVNEDNYSIQVHPKGIPIIYALLLDCFDFEIHNFVSLHLLVKFDTWEGYINLVEKLKSDSRFDIVEVI